MKGVNQKNFGSFITSCSSFATSALLIITGRSDKSVSKIVLSKVVMAHAIRKNNMKPKFFLKISDHQQSVAPAPSRGLPHTPTLQVVADDNSGIPPAKAR